MPDSTLPAVKLAVCVTCHFVPGRVRYWEALCANFPKLAQEVNVTFITNAADAQDQRLILGIGEKHGLKLSLFVPRGLGHPYLLPWSHFPVMREKHADPSYTHFLYQEDDMLVRPETIDYLLEAREILRPAQLLPAILRVEQKVPGGEWYATDVTEAVSLSGRAMVSGPGGATGFINLPSCYQAMYFLDRECMTEHLAGPSSHPDFGVWTIRERAAQGLTFTNRPENFKYRYVVPVDLASQMIDRRCFVHHLPNNYATDPAWVYGKRTVDELID